MKTKSVSQIMERLRQAAITGEATHIRSVIVSPSDAAAVAGGNDADAEIDITVTIGNRILLYRFAVIGDPTLERLETASPLYLEQDPASYRRDMFGRLPELCARPYSSDTIGPCTLRQMHPVTGGVAVDRDSSTDFLPHAEYGEAVRIALEAREKKADVRSAVLAWYRTPRNTPDISWTGTLSFDVSGRLTGTQCDGVRPFIACVGKDLPTPYHARLDGSSMGQILMHRETPAGPYSLIAVGYDGYGRAHTVVVPGTTCAYEMDFTILALSHFPPEEIFLFLNYTRSKLLDQMRRYVPAEQWRNPIAYPPPGRMDIADVTDSRGSGRSLHFYAQDTRGTMHCVEVAYGAYTRSDRKWNRIVRRYMPVPWTGWPEEERGNDCC